MTGDEGISREVKKRAAFIERTSDLSDNEALALAWKERGFSPSGIAKRVDVTEDTVAKYLERIAVRYGLSAVHPKPVSKRGETRLKEVTQDDLDELSPGVRRTWEKLAVQHVDVAPIWVTGDGQGVDR